MACCSPDASDENNVARPCPSQQNSHTPTDDPEESRKRASGEKVAIQSNSNTARPNLTSTRGPFREALQKSNRHSIECWANTLCDNYERNLLRTEKIT